MTKKTVCLVLLVSVFFQTKPVCADSFNLLKNGWAKSSDKTDPGEVGRTSHNQYGFAFYTSQRINNVIRNAALNLNIQRWLDRQYQKALQNRSIAPQPKTRLDIEGKGYSQDSKKLSAEMDLLLAFALDARLNGNKNSLIQAERFLVAWAETYRPSGNPINERKFVEYIAAYELTLNELSIKSRKVIDQFLGVLAKREIQYMHNAHKGKFDKGSNWVSSHIAILAPIGFILKDQYVINYVFKWYKSQLSRNILKGGECREIYYKPKDCRKKSVKQFAPGVTFDFIQRDSLTYHITSISELAKVALVAYNNGLDWISLKGADGQTLETAFDFLVPYVAREKKHYNFGESLYEEDKGRGKEHWFDPGIGVGVLTIATEFWDKHRAFSNINMVPAQTMFFYITFNSAVD